MSVARRNLNSRESGFALVVSLLLLVALSFVGIAALRNVTLQEKMAGNTYFRMVAFQESERAIAMSSSELALDGAYSSSGLPGGDSSSSSTRKIMTAGGLQSFWQTPATWSSTTDPTAINTGVTTRWIREDFGGIEATDGCDSSESQRANFSALTCKSRGYRVTATASDTTTGTRVVTQHVYFLNNDPVIK
jgi:type IV pilus assembly protein PilX